MSDASGGLWQKDWDLTAKLLGNVLGLMLVAAQQVIEFQDDLNEAGIVILPKTPIGLIE